MRKIICMMTVFGFFISSCSELEEPIRTNDDFKMTAVTKAIDPHDFDWEVVDWMPTPPGQAQIPMPWGGQGSISSFYGLDVLYDYKKFDGWRLVYSTFRDFGEKLIDPYFVLYNIYRGTLRFYFYLTSPFIGTSTYLQDALTIKSASGISSNIYSIDTNYL